MAHDEGLAEILRADLAEMPGLRETRMFGGVAFMLDGHMLCGVHKDATMFRVGKDNEPAALAVPGARPMDFTGRRMGGFVEVDDEAVGDEVRRGALMRLALGFVRSLPPK